MQNAVSHCSNKLEICACCHFLHLKKSIRTPILVIKTNYLFNHIIHEEPRMDER